jgi:hypothetical protein
MPGGNEYLFIFYSGLLPDCKPRKISKQAVMTGLRNFPISPGEIIGFLEWGSGVS